MDFEDALIRTGMTLVSGVKTVWDRIKQMWNSVRQRIKETWGAFRSLMETPEESTIELSEEALRDAVVASVQSILGDNPLQTICDCTVAEREQIVSILIKQIANAMRIKIPKAQIDVLKKDLAGYYSYEQDRIVINQSEITRHPMELDEASELLDTILHEMYHAFQHNAISNPSQFGVREETAFLWKRNFENYIAPEQNPRLYWEQPVETSARLFAHSVVLCF